MSVEVSVWRVDERLKPVSLVGMEHERDLQDIIASEISIVDPGLMVIGREVVTAFGQRIDILAIDSEGCLVVIELKRDQTPREVVAQILDYGSWVRSMKSEEIASTFLEYQSRYLGESVPMNIDDAMRHRFGSAPADLNGAHRLVIVARDLDSSTERIVSYLAEDYQVDINVVSFRAFQDGDRQYLTRVWLHDPNVHPIETTSSGGEWNGEYYVSFGEGPHRRWSDAKRYGFVSAGGGEWYVNTLRALQPGNRIWVNVPGRGYVGVGKVTASVVPFDDFDVCLNGETTPITDIELEAPEVFDEESHGEYFVGVQWARTVELEEAVKERGFFGNQNIVARPRASSWPFTVDRLRALWKLTD